MYNEKNDVNSHVNTCKFCLSKRTNVTRWDLDLVGPVWHTYCLDCKKEKRIEQWKK